MDLSSIPSSHMIGERQRRPSRKPSVSTQHACTPRHATHTYSNSAPKRVLPLHCFQPSSQLHLLMLHCAPAPGCDGLIYGFRGSIYSSLAAALSETVHYPIRRSLSALVIVTQGGRIILPLRMALINEVFLHKIMYD